MPSISGTSKIRFLLAIALLAFILTRPQATDYVSYFDVLSHAAMTLKGQAPYSDVATDFYGFRALLTNKDPYAPLGPALKTMGIEWDLSHSSTHPPTSFLIVAPVALLPWPISSMVWAWLMLAFLCLSLRLGLGFSWDVAILITVVSLFWPPIATSLDQVTIVWLSGLAMAYRFRQDRPFQSGLFIGVASFTKLLPAVLVFPFLIRRRWETVAGFMFSWLTALGILVLLAPKSLLRYFVVNRTNTLDVIMRSDNGSFLVFLERRIGTIGLFITLAILGFLLFLALRRYKQEPEKEIAKEEWDIYAFLAVLLMPVTWIYSVAPLLPNLLLLMKDRKAIVRILTICALIPPIIVPPWGSTTGIFGFLGLATTAIVLSQWDST